jgi:hypothetical protein
MTMWWVAGLGALVAIGLGTWLVMAGRGKKPAADKGQAGQAPSSDGTPAAQDVQAQPASEAVTDKTKQVATQAFDRQAEEDVEHIFNDQFREELRNRGRLHFEKIIGENAMFLQQDLRLTTSQLNDYMKQEITAKLKEEFTKYEQSIMDAKQLAIDSIEKTKLAVEENRTQLLKQLEQEYAEEKAREIKRFDENMTDVVNHYLIAAIGDQIDLSDQLEYILSNLEANKQAIIQDIVDGA